MADNRKMSVGWGEGRVTVMGLKGHEHRSRSNFISIATRHDEIIPFVMNRSKRYSSGINGKFSFYGFRNFRFYDKNRAPRHAIRPVFTTWRTLNTRC